RDRRNVHSKRREEPSATPSPERRTDLVTLEHADVVTAADGGERRRQTTRAGTDDDDAHQPLRVIVFVECTQCAILPPPRITAVTLSASASCSGVTPASTHADAYESMQYGSWIALATA